MSGTIPWGGSRRGAAAARRGLRRTRKGRVRAPGPVRGAAAKLRAFSRMIDQRFPSRPSLRTVVLAVGGTWAAWTFLIGDASLLTLWSLQRENARLTTRIAELRTEHVQLVADVRSLGDPGDVSALERVAREEHGFVKDGEVLVRFYR